MERNDYAVADMAILGKRNTLSIVRESAPGLYLDGGELGEILLPGRYIPANLKPKDKLDVFIYRDSEDRLVATTDRKSTRLNSSHERLSRMPSSA